MTAHPKQKKPTVLLVDGHSLAYRAFYALPPDLKTTSGQVTNAVYGFTSMIIKALTDFQTEFFAVAFDKGAPLERAAIRPEYKAQRTAPPDEFRQQVGLIFEVLHALQVPILEIPNVEADDIICILATSLVEQGAEVVVVTADRDFFQIVRPGLKIMMNRRGISDTVVYDEAAVFERYGFPPSNYLDYAALRGDASDNIEGVAGVGDKTASKLIVAHKTLEEVFKHLNELTPRISANLSEAQERLLVNREFFRFRTKEELASHGVDVSSLHLTLDDLRMGTWDFAAIRKLFDALEFRTLYDRLAEARPGESDAAMVGFEGQTRKVDDPRVLKELVDELKGSEAIAVRVTGRGARERPDTVAIATSSGAATICIGGNLPEAKAWALLGPLLMATPVITHGSKEALQRLAAAGIIPESITMDTEIAAYLVDPARGSYPLDELARRYLERDLKASAPEESEPSGDEGQQSLLDIGAVPEDDNEIPLQRGLEAMAVAELASILEKELTNRGALKLFTDLELPLAAVLAKVEMTGVKVDTGYLERMSKSISRELEAIQAEVFEHAGGPFNIGSPPQLREVLYDRLGLKPSKKTKTGYSTDARVLESLRNEHPIIDSILRYRERAKLKSTYLDALPPLVDATTGRIHCRFNQTVASTGRLSSESPNLQNIPIRSEEGKHIRRAFIAEPGNELVVADYSQIELRILAHLSQDPQLLDAFERGDDIHRLSIAKALDLEPDEVTPKLRSIGKMVSYGVTYGMGPFGLSQRLQIPVDQARAYIEGFFATYPRVRSYLDEVVVQAAQDGFTTTILGRRRYVPELKSGNPRVRSLGERMALNAPIQGSAADIIKLAMIKTMPPLQEDGRPERMVLTVHDELVFEVPEARVEEVAERVRAEMEGVIDLDAPLKADVSWGPNWAEAK